MRFGPKHPGLGWEESCSEAVVDCRGKVACFGCSWSPSLTIQLQARHKRDEDLEGVINYESLKGELDYLMGANC